jgi:hypothetical protein
MSACPLPDLAAVANRSAMFADPDATGRWNPKAQGLRRIGKFNPLPTWLSIRRFWRDDLGNVRKVNPSAKLCYATLLRICGPDGTATTTLDRLGHDLAMDRRQVHRVLVDLDNMGLIRRHQRGNNLPSQYEFLAHAWMLGEPELFAAPTPVHARVRPPPRHRALQADLPGMFPATMPAAPAFSSPETVVTFPPAHQPEMSLP